MRVLKSRATVKRIAVIGSGISGLAAAYYLSRKHQVFLFEREPRLGGHTHTVTVESSSGPVAIDTGFIVHNDRTYPNLIRLLTELHVPRVPSDMSFAVTCRKTGYEYSSRGLRGFFAQRRNAFRVAPYRLFGEIRRFNRQAPHIFRRADAHRLTVGDFLDEGRYTTFFRDFYLYPMASAVWSCTHNAVRAFPASMLIRFFDNHGMLTVNGHPQWKTIPGGCSRYIPLITAPLRDRIFTSASLRSISRDEFGATLHFLDSRQPIRCDHVVFASNADCVLPLLEDPSDSERDVLRHFSTSRNDVALHTDDNLLPQRHEARASWNYLLHQDARHSHGPATLTYHMNRLQSLRTAENFCITLNANSAIRPEKILQKFVYYHPIFTLDALRAQHRWHEINGVRHTSFCGAYWMNGFHEDGLNSALRVADALGVRV